MCCFVAFPAFEKHAHLLHAAALVSPTIQKLYGFYTMLVQHLSTSSMPSKHVPLFLMAASALEEFKHLLLVHPPQFPQPSSHAAVSQNAWPREYVQPSSPEFDNGQHMVLCRLVPPTARQTFSRSFHGVCTTVVTDHDQRYSFRHHVSWTFKFRELVPWPHEGI